MCIARCYSNRCFSQLSGGVKLSPMRTLSVLTSILMTATTLLGAEAPIRHVVSFKFKPDSSPSEIHAIESAFAALKTKIPQIQSLEWGTNISGEKLDKGFTHMWVLSFSGESDLKVYIEHPDHKAFVALLKPSLEDAFVVDFRPNP